MKACVEKQRCRWVIGVVKIVPIVEGDGEVSAVPVLLRKIMEGLMRYDIEIARPKSANGRANLKKEGGLERFIKYSWKEPDCSAIFILLDAEGECPLEIAREFSNRVESLGILFPVVIVIANRMYETWFLASMKSIAGQLDLPENLQPPEDVEAVGNPKAWINRHFPRGRAYKETQDQVAMTHLIEIDLARRSRSFQRLVHAIEQLLQAIDTEAKFVTPVFSGEADGSQ